MSKRTGLYIILLLLALFGAFFALVYTGAPQTNDPAYWTR